MTTPRTAALSALAEEDAALLGPDLPADVMLARISEIYAADDGAPATELGEL